MPTTVIAKVSVDGSIAVENQHAKRVLEREDCMCVKFRKEVRFINLVFYIATLGVIFYALVTIIVRLLIAKT